MKTSRVLLDVGFERLRQEQLKAEGRFKHTCADPEMNHVECLAVLVEEVGEVARAALELGGLVSDKHRDKVECELDLYKELIQVAAVAVAWAERLS